MSLEDEIAALDRIRSRPPYSLEDAAERYAWVWLYSGTAKEARREREMYLKGYDMPWWNGEGELPRRKV